MSLNQPVSQSVSLFDDSSTSLRWKSHLYTALYSYCFSWRFSSV